LPLEVILLKKKQVECHSYLWHLIKPDSKSNINIWSSTAWYGQDWRKTGMFH